MDIKQHIEKRLERLRVVMATSKSARSPKTEESYTGHMKQFMWFCAYHPAVKNGMITLA